MNQGDNSQPVLVFDDEPLILRYVSSCLQSSGYNSVLQARTALEARAALQRQPLAILITDVFMPDVDGRDFATEFLEANPDGRVVFMTGFAPEELPVPAPLQSVSSVVEKPFSSERLLQMLARGSTANPPALPSPAAIARSLSSPQTHLSAAGC